MGCKRILRKREILNIVNEPKFKDANSALLAICVKIKKEEKETVQHKEPSETVQVFQCIKLQKDYTRQGICGYL